jgi:hypothetical protein
MAAATNMGYAGKGVSKFKRFSQREGERGADLDVLPEIPRTTVPVLVTWPPCAVHGDGAGKVKRMEWFFC